MPIKTKTSLERVITKAGGAAALARQLGITTQAVSQWRRVPVGRVLQVEQLTGVAAAEMRPDVYRRERAA